MYTNTVHRSNICGCIACQYTMYIM